MVATPGGPFTRYAAYRETHSSLRQAKFQAKDLKKVEHDKMDYQPFRRNFYKEAKEITDMTSVVLLRCCYIVLSGVRE